MRTLPADSSLLVFGRFTHFIDVWRLTGILVFFVSVWRLTYSSLLMFGGSPADLLSGVWQLPLAVGTRYQN